MTIRIAWWLLPVGLFLAPCVYSFVRKPCGDWDFQIDTFLVFGACWAGAVGILIGRVL